MKRSWTNSSRRRRWRVVAGAMALGLTAAACGSSDGVATDAAVPGESAGQTAASSSLVAATTTGGQIDFGALEGNDYVLWFWAPW